LLPIPLSQVRGTDDRIVALEKGGGAASDQLASVRAEVQGAADGARDAAVAEARGMVDAATAAAGEEARRAAESAREAALEEAMGAVDAKAAELRAAIPGLMKDEMSALMRGQAVAELETRMHSALDAGLDTIRNEADKYGASLQAQVTDIRAQVVGVVGV
jgi:hypothetical protein